MILVQFMEVLSESTVDCGPSIAQDVARARKQCILAVISSIWLKRYSSRVSLFVAPWHRWSYWNRLFFLNCCQSLCASAALFKMLSEFSFWCWIIADGPFLFCRTVNVSLQISSCYLAGNHDGLLPWNRAWFKVSAYDCWATRASDMKVSNDGIVFATNSLFCHNLFSTLFLNEGSRVRGNRLSKLH